MKTFICGGASGVTFDGLNTGGNSLTIKAENIAIRIDGASNNLVTNCTILGGAAESGAITISSSTNKQQYGFKMYHQFQ